MELENSIDDLTSQLEKTANLFLKLLQASKMFETQLSAIHCIREVAKFIDQHSLFPLKIYKEQSTQTFPVHELSTKEDKETESTNCSNQNDNDTEQRKSKRKRFISSKLLEYKMIENKKKVRSKKESDDRSDQVEDASEKKETTQAENNREELNGERAPKHFMNNEDSSQSLSQDSDVSANSSDITSQWRPKKISSKNSSQKCHKNCAEDQKVKKQQQDTVCKACGKQFRSLKSLIQHKTKICQTGKVKRIKRPAGIYKCDVCGLSYTGTARLNEHKLKHTSKEEEISSITEDNAHRFKCNICGRIYTSKCRLTKHLSTHDSEKDWSCDYCEKRFPFRRDLKVHSPTHSKGKDKLYTCHVCNVTSPSLNAFYYHTKTHQIDRPFVCTTCGKSFMRIHELQKHNRLHTGRPPQSKQVFICEVCRKVYKSKAALQVHMKIHLGIYDHPCEYCEKKFKTLAELNHHRRVHTREKPYKCDTCQRMFSRQSTLVNHRRTHTGERRSLCNECGMAFKNGNDLKRHIKRVHKENASKEAANPVAHSLELDYGPITTHMQQATSIEAHHTIDPSPLLTTSVSAVIVVTSQSDDTHVSFSIPSDLEHTHVTEDDSDPTVTHMEDADISSTSNAITTTSFTSMPSPSTMLIAPLQPFEQHDVNETELNLDFGSNNLET